MRVPFIELEPPTSLTRGEITCPTCGHTMILRERNEVVAFEVERCIAPRVESVRQEGLRRLHIESMHTLRRITGDDERPRKWEPRAKPCAAAVRMPTCSGWWWYWREWLIGDDGEREEPDPEPVNVSMLGERDPLATFCGEDTGMPVRPNGSTGILGWWAPCVAPGWPTS